ncbi:MAG TPA: hypothetical protein VGH20_04700 [Myxococcales bacterium]
MRALLLIACVAAPLPALAARKLVDEVVAVVDAHTITLSELQAETRVRLVEAQGPVAAALPLDGPLLAASLRKTIDERIILAEIERLKLYDLDRAEVDSLLSRLRNRFANQAEWEAFTRKIELTDEEIAKILARELRVARYLENRLKLSAQIRDSDLPAGPEREKLAQEKYQRLLADLLDDLRKRVTVRVLDPLDSEPGVAALKGG